MTQEILALTRRWFIHTTRQPAALLAGVVQPLMWLILFGGLFHQAPAGMFGVADHYLQFLAAGIIIFTAFTAALNSGVPVLFDKELGFLSRLLVAPLVSRFSIVLASALYILTTSLLQTSIVIAATLALGAHFPSGPGGLLLALLLTTLLTLGFTMLSLGLAFVLRAHFEMLAIILLANLPLMFISTALAPLSFMPRWLQWIASLNPLTIAIEPIRFLALHGQWHLGSVVLAAPWGPLTLGLALGLLALFDVLAALVVQGVIRRQLR